MARKSKQSAEQIEEQEYTDWNRAHKRKKVYRSGIMDERDRGWARLRSNKEVIMKWNLPDTGGELVFGLHIRDGKYSDTIYIDAEEFRRYLRWV